MKKLFITLMTATAMVSSANLWAACAANIEMNTDVPAGTEGNTITHVPVPEESTDVANKIYVDALSGIQMSAYKGAGTYLEAEEKCRNATDGGFTDWRLPTLHEAVVGFAELGNEPFTVYYWTSTPYYSENLWLSYVPNHTPSSGGFAWTRANPNVTGSAAPHVRCVR